jgi:indolepyruvate ferredoxin oxidoreductase
VGGTGIVTVGALTAMAAHLEGKSASVLDFMGFAQKGGSVLAFVRMADTPARLNQVRIDTQQADALVACDAVVGASAEALQAVRHGRTRVLVNTHELPVAESLRNPDAQMKIPLLIEKLRFAAGDDRVETLDAQGLAEALLGDSILANMLALGYAWQRGLLPVGLESLLRAIELNNVAVDTNKLAFSLGRLEAAAPSALRQLLQGDTLDVAPAETLDALVARGVAHLTGYQNAGYAARYAHFVGEVRAREEQFESDANLPLTTAVARSLLKLMAYKDEYEVARLYTDGPFRESLRQQFEGDFALEFYMAPPLLARIRDGRPPRKIRIGSWLYRAMQLLARGRVLRGTVLDVFGRTHERRTERQLIEDYVARIRSLLPALDARRLPLAADIAALPLAMRGYGHVKLANVALARLREAELLHRFDPQTYPRPASAQPGAGQLRGIAIVDGRKAAV